MFAITHAVYTPVVFLTLTVQDRSKTPPSDLPGPTDETHLSFEIYTDCTLTKDRKLRLTLNLIFYKTTTCNKLGKIFQRQLK